MIAEGERAERLKKGCTINGVRYIIRRYGHQQEAQGVDLLVACLKYGALPGAMESIRKEWEKDTR